MVDGGKHDQTRVNTHEYNYGSVDAPLRAQYPKARDRGEQMGRTAKIMGTLLHSEVAIRLTQNDRLMETLSRTMGMSIQLRHMIDQQIEHALRRSQTGRDEARRPEGGREELRNRIKELERRMATLEAQADTA
ncbi:MAG: hypothetical protein ACI9U2_004897 [Bradymonadia bacterium]